MAADWLQHIAQSCCCTHYGVPPEQPPEQPPEEPTTVNRCLL
jgi:hypothetical protein